MMKMIVLVALLATTGCSKKGSNKGSDCDSAISQGMANFTASRKTAANPKMQENMQNMVGKLKTALTQRCNEDKWPPEVMTCFTTVAKMKDMLACQAKLSAEQQAKLKTEIQQVMLGAMGGMRMPSDDAGHPPMLTGSGDPGAGGPGGSAAPAGSPPPAGSPTPAGSPPPAGSGAAPAGSAAPAAGGW